LKLNGVIVDSKKITLAGGESKIVTFTLVKEEAGTFNVEISGLKGTFTVKEITTQLPWNLYLIIASTTVIVTLVAITIYLKKHRI
jgi:hypothetical protein